MRLRSLRERRTRVFRLTRNSIKNRLQTCGPTQLLFASREQREGVDVSRSHDSEVSTIDGHHRGHPEPSHDGNDRGIDAAER